MVEYDCKWLYKHMDGWQSELLGIVGNFILLCGRQVGKSEIVAKKIADYLLNNRDKKILIVSGVERQAQELYSKVLYYIQDNYPWELRTGKFKPLKGIFHLKNGSILLTEPLGVDGSSARRHTVDGIVFEEMQLIPEMAYGALTPMLLTTGGFIWMLGTAWATEGYVYERLSDPDFQVFRINSEEVAEERPEPQKTIMQEHLKKERERLGTAMYQQEYLAIPSENIRQIFPDTLIKRCQVLERRDYVKKEHRHACGVDPAGLGQDEGAISVLDTENEDFVEQVEFIATKKLLTTEMTDKIKELDEKYDFDKIYVDDGGVGVGGFSELMNDGKTKSKTVAINNSHRSLTRDKKRKTKIIKEDLYINLLRMMERGKIRLLKDAEIRESLKSARFEYSKDTKQLLIRSNYNHPVESLIRAAWDAEGKSLNLKVYSIKV